MLRARVTDLLLIVNVELGTQHSTLLHRAAFYSVLFLSIDEIPTSLQRKR